MRLGCQISIAKGLDISAEQAHRIGADCFQFFTRNPRGGRARAIESGEISRWAVLREEYGISPIVGHLPYTVNLASESDGTRRFARETIAADLARIGEIGAEFLVVHPGSCGRQSVEEGLSHIADSLARDFLPYTGSTQLLLETMSGSGSEIGAIAEIGEIIRRLGKPEGLGACIDSCHLFAMGYDLSRAEGLDRVLDEFDRHIGVSRLKCVHLNDSKFPLGLHKDRHERIGQGSIGREGFVNMLQDPVLSQLPFILETPVQSPLEYADEIAILRSWLQ